MPFRFRVYAQILTSAHHYAARVSSQQLRSQEDDEEICFKQLKRDLAVTIALLVLAISTKSASLTTLTKHAQLGCWLLILIALLISRRVLYKLHEWRELAHERRLLGVRVASFGQFDATPLRPLGRVEEEEGEL